MYRVLLAATIAVILLGAFSDIALADEGLQLSIAAERVTQDPGADVDPALAIGPDGRALLVWKHYGSGDAKAQLQYARWPEWAPIQIASLTAASPEQVSISLAGYAPVQLAWSQPATDTQTISQQPLGAGATARGWSLPLDPHRVFATDRNGDLHWAVAQDRTITYVSSSQDITLTITLEREGLVEPALAVDDRTRAYLAWSGSAADEQGSSVFVTSLVSDAVPIEVGPGRAVKLVAGPSGRVHLAWVADDGLHYANSQDWSATSLVTGQLVAPDQFVLATQPDGTAHIAWVQDGILWHASSRDWQRSQTPLFTTDVTLSALTLAIDADACPHVAWTAKDDQGNADVYYMRTPAPLPQLCIAHPWGGEMLTSDALALAESNLAINRFVRVAFYLQTQTDKATGDQGPLTSLGLDQTSQDGWSAPLHISDLDSARRYRVMAFGATYEGQLVRAEGDWFTVQPLDVPSLWVCPPGLTRGQASIGVLANTSQDLKLDLFLQPVERQPTGEPGRESLPLPSPAYYLGQYDSPWSPTWSTMAGGQIEYDSSAVPDGSYQAIVTATDRSGRTIRGVSEPFVIENALYPNVEWVAPTQGAVFALGADIELSTIASDLDGQVQRVDFYLERRQAALQAQYADRVFEREIPRLVWLGSDVDGADGWNASILVNEMLDGDNWYAWAVAFDDQGLAGSARSERFSIIGRRRPHLQLVSPLSGSVMHGSETIRIFAPQGTADIEHMQAFAQYPDGALLFLGDMEPVEGYWLYAWDTSSLPDGDYALVIVTQSPDGRRSLTRCDHLAINNALSQYSFQEPSPGADVSSPTYLSIQSLGNPEQVAEVHFYYRDPTGALTAIGQGIRRMDHWGLLWDVARVFDGHYDLLATVSDTQGHIVTLEQSISVHRSDLSLALSRPRRDEQWRGAHQIVWQADNPSTRPLSVTIEYSPDAGNHWITVAHNITATQSFSWDTTRYPDGAQALLRVVATDGVCYQRVTSERFIVDNTNQAPTITLLSPLMGSILGAAAPVAWQATDPDDQSLQIRIEYRGEADAEWMLLADGLVNSGRYVWNTTNLPPNQSYALRITTSDPLGAARSDSVQGVRTTSNRPPVVQLLWPNSGIRVEREVIILWEASDPDNDRIMVDLYYSDNAGQTWLPLAEGLGNTGYYVWQVSYLPAGAQYRTRIVARDDEFRAESQSDGVFTVGDVAHQVTLLTPVGGERLSGARLISWSSFGPNQAALQASLSTRPVGQIDWQPLTKEAPDDGFFVWDTTKYTNGDYELRITVTDGQSSVSATLPRPISIVNRQNHAPQVTLIAPQSGDRWSGLREIVWRAWDRDGDVLTATLHLSADGGQTWSKLTSMDARTSRFLWDTRRVAPAPHYRLRIEVSDGVARAEHSARGAFYLINRYGQPPYVELATDLASQGLRNGLITWVAEDADHDLLSLSLAISQDSGHTWREIARDIHNTREYAIDATTTTIGKDSRLRLIADDGLYQSESTLSFGMLEPSFGYPQIEIQAPRESSALSGVHEIRWQASALVGETTRISLDASRDGGLSWLKLGEDPENTGRYNLDTTMLANGTYLLRLTATNRRGSSARVVGPLSIENTGRDAPLAAFIIPRGGEVWSGVQEIRWRTWDADEDTLGVNLSYSVDEGANWRILAYNIEDSGSYVWDTTTIPDCERVWLRITVSDGRFSAQSYSAEALTVRNGHTPTIILLAPHSGAQIAGSQPIAWVANHHSGRIVHVLLELSTDMGQSWQVLARDLPSRGSYLWDTTRLPESSRALIRVTASDGAHSALDATRTPVIIRGNPQPPSLFFYLP